MSEQYYTLKIAGLERQLKRFPVSDTLDIAAFILFGDVELTEACAKELLKKAPEFDYIVTPEAKSIPLAYEMSRLSGKKYIEQEKALRFIWIILLSIKKRVLLLKRNSRFFLATRTAICLPAKKCLLLMMLFQQERVLRLFRAL